MQASNNKKADDKKDSDEGSKLKKFTDEQNKQHNVKKESQGPNTKR